jgi:hypothetical protein
MYLPCRVAHPSWILSVNYNLINEWCLCAATIRFPWCQCCRLWMARISHPSTCSTPCPCEMALRKILTMICTTISNDHTSACCHPTITFWTTAICVYPDHSTFLGSGQRIIMNLPLEFGILPSVGSTTNILSRTSNCSKPNTPLCWITKYSTRDCWTLMIEILILERKLITRRLLLRLRIVIEKNDIIIRWSWTFWRRKLLSI